MIIRIIKIFLIIFVLFSCWHLYETKFARKKCLDRFLSELSTQNVNKFLIEDKIQKIKNSLKESGPEYWYDSDFALFKNSEWVFFKNNSWHRNDYIGDLTVFINPKGEVYISNFHFCVDSVSFFKVEQPESFLDFLKKTEICKFEKL